MPASLFGPSGEPRLSDFQIQLGVLAQRVESAFKELRLQSHQVVAGLVQLVGILQVDATQRLPLETRLEAEVYLLEEAVLVVDQILERLLDLDEAGATAQRLVHTQGCVLDRAPNAVGVELDFVLLEAAQD